MAPSPYRRRVIRPPVLGGVLCALLLTCSGAEPRAAGPPTCLPSTGHPPACPPPVREQPPRPPTGRESVAAFVDGLSSTDAAFEVQLGQGRILTIRSDLVVPGKPPPLIALGDPSVVFVRPLNARQIRLIGQRIGVTDLSITTPDGAAYTFEVRVVADLNALRGQLQCQFPDASLKLTQVRDHVVVEGEARDAVQVTRILETIRAYFISINTVQNARGGAQGGAPPPVMPPAPDMPPAPPLEGAQQQGPPPSSVAGTSQVNFAASAAAVVATAQLTVPETRIINLIKVPGSQQVLLKVRVAELNRTAMRQIGADFLFSDGTTIVGTQIGGAGVGGASSVIAGGPSVATGNITTSPATTLFGLLRSGDLNLLLQALRRNSMLKILAEPNLVALNGQAASFQAGGEFPVPVPQVGAGGVAPTITVQFQKFGVLLDFVPTILDGDVIRLSVDPEVSSIDFSIGTTLVAGGSVVPGLQTRKAHTVVELREGQTLAIAGLLQLSLDGNTSRIPGLGDLPILGPFFQNTTGMRMEKELIVLVTPYLIEPMNPGQVPPSPGDEVNAPTDLEFYLLHQIEGRTGVDWRATIQYPQTDIRCPRGHGTSEVGVDGRATIPYPQHDAPSMLRCLFRVEDTYLRGPHGFCE